MGTIEIDRDWQETFREFASNLLIDFARDMDGDEHNVYLGDIPMGYDALVDFIVRMRTEAAEEALRFHAHLQEKRES